MENPSLQSSQTPVRLALLRGKLKPLLFIAAGVILLGAVGIGGYYLGSQKFLETWQLSKKSSPASSKTAPDGTATPVEEVERPVCPAEEKVCDDGSVVGRAGLDCEFVACP
ncbi:MAG TPA: hypothetical protein DEP87_01305 [Candidatus Pacebacteria bacterium]|nr:hypothetical protein [Candidatus Paceibacterota bacterium]